jgi:hypothetical protein
MKVGKWCAEKVVSQMVGEESLSDVVIAERGNSLTDRLLRMHPVEGDFRQQETSQHGILSQDLYMSITHF